MPPGGRMRSDGGECAWHGRSRRPGTEAWARARYHPAMTADDVPGDPLDRFRWHPEPELIGIRDAAASRDALERVGQATWSASLDWLYDRAMVRAMGMPTGFEELREAYFGAARGPGPAPRGPRRLDDVLDD